MSCQFQFLCRQFFPTISEKFLATFKKFFVLFYIFVRFYLFLGFSTDYQSQRGPAPSPAGTWDRPALVAASRTPSSGVDPPS